MLNLNDNFLKLISYTKLLVTSAEIAKVAIKIDSISILKWLEASYAERKVYWKSRDCNLERGGIHVCHKIDDVSFEKALKRASRMLDSKSDLPRHRQVFFYYAASFHYDSQQTLPNFDIFIPRFEIEKIDDDYYLSCNVFANEIKDRSFANTLKNLWFKTIPTIQNTLKQSTIENTTYDPNYHRWQKNVQKAKVLFSSSDLKKVVLSRKFSMTFDRTQNPLFIMQELQKFSKNTFDFVFQISKELSFLGLSPELLFRRCGRKIFTEAIAGSNVNDVENISNGANSIDDKTYREHSIVEQFIRKELQNFSSEICLNDKLWTNIGYIRHVKQSMSATLNDDILDGQIIAKLHPTPAVCGFPTDLAKEFLSNAESHHREWYAGPLGIISKNMSETCVAIRSMILKSNTLEAFSGAGIVEGSDPLCEWQEIENKIQPLKNAILNITNSFEAI